MRKSLAASLLALASCTALAQGYPSRPIRIVVPFPPGGVVDNTARFIGQSLTTSWGQPIVVENRPGANGNIGMEVCAKAAPDGYTVCLPAGVIVALNPYTYTKLPFEPLELVPVIHVGTLDQALTVNAELPVKSVRELVEYSKSHPQSVSFASLGVGSTGHLYSEWFNVKAGASFVHVPYKGSPDILRAMASGEVQVSTNTPAVVLPYVKSGKVHVLAVVAGKGQRSPLYPDVPTLQEQGFELEFRNWLALFLPPGSPQEIARRWNTDVNKLLADRQWVEKFLTSQAVTASGGTPEFLVSFLRNARESARELVKIAKIGPT